MSSGAVPLEATGVAVVMSGAERLDHELCHLAP
jgi:hypothetical protein